MPRSAPSSPWAFFGLVLGVSAPLYLLATVKLPVASFLPVTAVMAFAPAVVGLALVIRERGRAGAFLLRAFDVRRVRGPAWLLTALLLAPLIAAAQCAIASPEAFATLHWYSPLKAAGFTLMFFVGAIGEELGWQGYAYPALRQRRGALAAALIIGTVWALWHVVPFVGMGRSTDWIVWQVLGTICTRVLMVWMYEKGGGSVFLAVVYHAMDNAPWGWIVDFNAVFHPLAAFVVIAPLAAAAAVSIRSPALARSPSDARP